MSVKKKKHAVSPTKSRLITIATVVFAALLLGVGYSFYNKNAETCDSVVSSSKKLIADKKYKQASSYLKSKNNVCQADSKHNLSDVQYKRYSAVSAFRSGNNKEAKKLADEALEGFKKLSNNEKGKLEDSFVFSDSMIDILQFDPSQEAQQ